MAHDEKKMYFYSYSDETIGGVPVVLSFYDIASRRTTKPRTPFPRFGWRIVPALPHRSRLEPATEEQRVVETEITYQPIIHLSL